MSTASIRRSAIFLAPSALLAIVALLLPSCESAGNFTLLGYTTRPNYRCDIHSVRVPIFKNNAYRDATRQGIEMDLTQAIIRQIEAKTPFKVNTESPDTELTGSIDYLNKGVLNRNQRNLPRETETTLACSVKWVDLRTGENLSRPAHGPGSLPPPALPGSPPAVPGTPPPPSDKVAVFSLGHFIPEIGQSSTTAYKQNVDNLAIQIVSMMEEPW